MSHVNHDMLSQRFISSQIYGKLQKFQPVVVAYLHIQCTCVSCVLLYSLFCQHSSIRTSPSTHMRLVEEKAFLLVNKWVQWQAMFACLHMCWMCVVMVGSKLLWAGVQIASLVTILCCVATIHCIVVSINTQGQAIQNYETWHHKGRKIYPLCRGKVSPPQAKYFLWVYKWQNGDRLLQMHISYILTCINIMIMSVPECCLMAQSVLPLHTMQFDDLNEHVCFSLTSVTLVKL